MSVDFEAAQRAVYDLLAALGEDPDSEALQGTPDRVARAWCEMLAGRDANAEDVLRTTFESGDYDQIIALKNIPFYSTCEHHLIPFRGVAHVAYVPKLIQKEKSKTLDDDFGSEQSEDSFPTSSVVGLSKLARLVEIHARRLQLQERMTVDIADDLERILKPEGVAVIIEAQHLCMCARGIQKDGATMVTSRMRGIFWEIPQARAEVMKLFGL